MMIVGKRLLTKVAPHAKLLRAIAHPHRLAIIYLLAYDSLWTKDLRRCLNLPANLLNHHLKQLLAAGWLTKKQEGRHAAYSLNPKAFKELPSLLADTPFWRELAAKLSR